MTVVVDEGHAEPLGHRPDVDQTVGGATVREWNAPFVLAQTLGLQLPAGLPLELVGGDVEPLEDHRSPCGRLRVHASSPCYVPRRLRRGGTRMVLGSALDIFSREGFSYLSRWSHVFVGITWIGLLYFFNFVQVPAYAQMEASARNNAIDKLTSRALWWFRWAAAATLVSGIALLFIDPKELYKSDFMKSAPGVAIYAGILLAVTMFLNVWLVIWPNQKKAIARRRRPHGRRCWPRG